MEASHPVIADTGYPAPWTTLRWREIDKVDPHGPTASKCPRWKILNLHRQTGGLKTNSSRNVVGIDIARRVFQLHWIDRETGEIVSLQLKREKFLARSANRQPCLVGMEDCGGAQHWARIGKMDEEIADVERRIKRWLKEDDACRRSAGIPGVGPLTATAAVAVMGAVRAFKSSREFAAFAGPVLTHAKAPDPWVTELRR